jgi:hypothetical protein
MKEIEKKLNKLEDKIAGMEWSITMITNRLTYARERERKVEEEKYADMNRISAFWWGMLLGFVVSFALAGLLLKVMGI